METEVSSTRLTDRVQNLTQGEGGGGELMGFSISTLLEVDGEGEFFKPATSIPTVTLTALKKQRALN